MLATTSCICSLFKGHSILIRQAIVDWMRIDRLIISSNVHKYMTFNLSLRFLKQSLYWHKPCESVIADNLQQLFLLSLGLNLPPSLLLPVRFVYNTLPCVIVIMRNETLGKLTTSDTS